MAICVHFTSHHATRIASFCHTYGCRPLIELTITHFRSAELMLRTVLQKALHQRASTTILQGCVQHTPALCLASFPEASEQCQTHANSYREAPWLPTAMPGNNIQSLQSQLHAAATAWQAAAQCSAHQDPASTAAPQFSRGEGRGRSIPFPYRAYSTALAERLGAIADDQTEQKEADHKQLDLAR